jgi:hypothetical protein
MSPARMMPAESPGRHGFCNGAAKAQVGCLTRIALLDIVYSEKLVLFLQNSASATRASALPALPRFAAGPAGSAYHQGSQAQRVSRPVAKSWEIGEPTGGFDYLRR